MATTAGIGDLTRYNLAPRKRGRVVDCTGLENRRLERVREFESHRFRQTSTQNAPSGAFCICAHHKISLFNFLNLPEEIQ